jgi:hypothetical protein
VIGLRAGLKVGPRVGLAVGVVSDELSAGGAPVDPGVDVTAPLEAITGDQLATQLGRGNASIWKYINPLNDLTGLQYPTVGVTALTPSAGGVQGTAGPLDEHDFGVTATDADADGQWSGTAGVIDPAGNMLAILCEVRFSGLPAGNRNVCGHDGTDDFFIQYMQTTGRVRSAAIAGATVVSEIAANHNDGDWHTILAFHIPGASGFTKCVSDLGASTPASTAAQRFAALATSVPWSSWRSLTKSRFRAPPTWCAK